MVTLIEQLNRWSAAWAEATWAVVWQSMILIGLVAAICWMLRWQSPALRYWLWLILAAKLLVMPFWRMELPLPAWFGAEPAGAAVVELAGSAPALEGVASASVPAQLHEPADVRSSAPAESVSIISTVEWATWVLLAWLAVVVFEIVRVVVQYVRLRGLLNASQPAEAHVQTLVAQCSRSMGLSYLPEVRQVSIEGSPLVCGVFKQLLLLPQALAKEIDSDALRQIVFHELAHLKRRDLLTVWVLHAMRTVYWFHPAVHWVAYRAGLDRELACDHLALTHSGVSVAAYAHTLIDAAGRAAQPMVLNAAVAAGLDGGVPLQAQQ
jgi:bla regulator protein BlaR1